MGRAPGDATRVVTVVVVTRGRGPLPRQHRSSAAELLTDKNVMGFGRRPNVGAAAGTGAVVRKPPRKESAGSGAPWLSERYGDLAGAGGAAGASGGRERCGDEGRTG